jgi:hypothetical protein
MFVGPMNAVYPHTTRLLLLVSSIEFAFVAKYLAAY